MEPPFGRAPEFPGKNSTLQARTGFLCNLPSPPVWPQDHFRVADQNEAAGAAVAAALADE
jgi:hypothetical protein